MLAADGQYMHIYRLHSSCQSALLPLATRAIVARPSAMLLGEGRPVRHAPPTVAPQAVVCSDQINGIATKTRLYMSVYGLPRQMLTRGA